MAGVEVKSTSSPDETRSLADKGETGVFNLSGHTVLHTTFQPGWRWSEHVKPVAGTDKCEATHLVYCMTGRMKVAHDDGTEAEIGPGDVAVIEPGHDAWIVGDEPFVGIDFQGAGSYAKPQG